MANRLLVKLLPTVALAAAGPILAAASSTADEITPFALAAARESAATLRLTIPDCRFWFGRDARLVSGGYA